MALQFVSATNLIQNCRQEPNRPLANFPSNIWGDQFLSCPSNSLTSDAEILQEFEALKQEIRRMLISTSGNTFEILCLIDAVQRLGVAYHFEKEIEDALEKLYHASCDDDNNLETTALRFRLLRQQGHYVPCDVFDKFKNDQGKFKASLINDVPAMLCLYEAAYLGIPGEDILDEAISFTTSHLGSIVDQVSPQLAEQINHVLNRPLRKCLPRLEARNYINVFSGDDSQSQTLLKLAKLDFGMLQVQHRKEISSIIKWWKNLDFARKLPYARDRVVECYFWAMGVYFEPQYAFARKILTKVINMFVIIDDTYDAYGTYEELEVFTDAIQRWEVSTIEVLPEYMKHIYRALLDIYSEAEWEISKERRSYCMHYAIEATKRLVRAYVVEAKWCNEGYVPNLEEYMQNSLVSSAYPALATICFLGMGEIADNHAFDWISNDPPILKASTIISRLMDDIVSREFEQKRKHVATVIECYLKEHNVSKEEAVKQFRKEIANAWKDINGEFLKPTAVQMPLLMRILNFSRVIDVIYKDDDGFTNCHVLKDDITSLLIDPVQV